VFETAAFLKTPDATKKLANVMRSPPLAVADHVQSRLFLQADGKQDQIVEDGPAREGWVSIAPLQQVA
jgi:hypothetical protein